MSGFPLFQVHLWKLVSHETCFGQWNVSRCDVCHHEVKAVRARTWFVRFISPICRYFRWWQLHHPGERDIYDIAQSLPLMLNGHVRGVRNKTCFKTYKLVGFWKLLTHDLHYFTDILVESWYEALIIWFQSQTFSNSIFLCKDIWESRKPNMTGQCLEVFRIQPLCNIQGI